MRVTLDVPEGATVKVSLPDKPAFQVDVQRRGADTGWKLPADELWTITPQGRVVLADLKAKAEAAEN